MGWWMNKAGLDRAAEAIQHNNGDQQGHEEIEGRHVLPRAADDRLKPQVEAAKVLFVVSRPLDASWSTEVVRVQLDEENNARIKMCLHMRVWTQSFEIHLDRSRLSSLLWKKAGPDSDVSSQVFGTTANY